MGALVKAMVKTNQFQDLNDRLQGLGEHISSQEVMSSSELTTETVEAIFELWDNPKVKERFKNKSDVQIIDSAAFFFNNIKRIAEAGYVPSDEDILFSRTRTTGITEFCFQLAGSPIRLVDVGGQRSERRKWIHCFDEVSAIFFIVAISEFDQKLREDETTNRMLEAFHLFQEICAYDTFRNVSIILFMNKSDLFEDKIGRVKMSDFLTEYNGPNEKEACIKWLRDQFNQLAAGKTIYPHVTNATNKENVEKVFGAVQSIFMNKTIDGFVI
jgi:GTPase SAR1 family protein